MGWSSWPMQIILVHSGYSRNANREGTFPHFRESILSKDFFNFLFFLCFWRCVKEGIVLFRWNSLKTVTTMLLHPIFTLIQNQRNCACEVWSSKYNLLFTRLFDYLLFTNRVPSTTDSFFEWKEKDNDYWHCKVLR